MFLSSEVALARRPCQALLCSSSAAHAVPARPQAPTHTLALARRSAAVQASGPLAAPGQRPCPKHRPQEDLGSGRAWGSPLAGLAGPPQGPPRAGGRASPFTSALRITVSSSSEPSCSKSCTVSRCGCEAMFCSCGTGMKALRRPRGRPAAAPSTQGAGQPPPCPHAVRWAPGSRPATSLSTQGAGQLKPCPPSA